jgi:hypothetical protein
LNNAGLTESFSRKPGAARWSGLRGLWFVNEIRRSQRTRTPTETVVELAHANAPSRILSSNSRRQQLSTICSPDIELGTLSRAQPECVSVYITGLKLALLLNFKHAKLDWKRIVN